MTPSLHQLLVAAARALALFAQGRSLDAALDTALHDASPALRPGSQALAYAAVRAQARCSALIAEMLPRRPPPKVEALLRAALAQALDARYPPHTLVNEAVQAAKRFVPAQAGLVNAVLRRFGREREALLAAAMRGDEARHEHPAWWIARLRADWPQQAEALLAAANAAPPFSLRVNTARGSVADYAARLPAARPLGALAPDGLVLDPPCPVQQLPGFADGAVSVQDGAAQLAAPLLLDGAGSLPPLRPGARVLDACAAPGGKTAHLLEHRPDLRLLALDRDADRLTRVGETLARLGLQAQSRAADAADVRSWWDGELFDAILLDAPCSAAGINRRHPDVRWLRRAADLDALVAEQARLLDALWPLLAPGGRLLYATCSLFKCEGEAQAAAFAQRCATARYHEVAGHTGHLLGLPENPGFSVPSDGFFYALFCR